MTAVVDPEGNRDVVVGFPTNGVLRGARDGQRCLQVFLLDTYDTCWLEVNVCYEGSNSW